MKKATKTLRTLIVDDEPLARERIRMLLQTESDVEIVAECAEGQEAIDLIRAQKPHLIFLDIQMPEIGGFEVLSALDPEHLPWVIFVTAYDQYAVRAFEVHALDYLLKPFDRARFYQALKRAKRHIERAQHATFNQQLMALLEEAPSKRLQRLAIKSDGRIFFLLTKDVDWIEAAGNYIRLHANGDAHLLRETMKGIEAKLDPDTFIRIHRSIIINLNRIKEMQSWFHGEYVVVLQDGTRLTLSRSYRESVQKKLGIL